MMGGERAPRVGGRVLALLLFTVFFTVAALAHVWVRLQVVRLGYQISDETEREKEILQRHRKLEVEKALLVSPERLERLATEKLRLVMPDPSIIHDLGMGAMGPTGRRAAAEPTGRRATAEPTGSRAASEPTGSRATSEPTDSQSAAAGVAGGAPRAEPLQGGMEPRGVASNGQPEAQASRERP